MTFAKDFGDIGQATTRYVLPQELGFLSFPHLKLGLDAILICVARRHTMVDACPQVVFLSHTQPPMDTQDSYRPTFPSSEKEQLVDRRGVPDTAKQATGLPCCSSDQPEISSGSLMPQDQKNPWSAGMKSLPRNSRWVPWRSSRRLSACRRSRPSRGRGGAGRSTGCLGNRLSTGTCYNVRPAFFSPRASRSMSCTSPTVLPPSRRRTISTTKSPRSRTWKTKRVVDVWPSTFSGVNARRSASLT